MQYKILEILDISLREPETHSEKAISNVNKLKMIRILKKFGFKMITAIGLYNAGKNDFGYEIRKTLTDT